MNPEFSLFKRSVYAMYPQLTEEEWAFMLARVYFETASKKSYLFRQGDLQSGIYFIVSGLVRGYYVDREGQEITVRFIQEGEYATHYTALLHQRPSMYDYQCLEDCTWIHIPWKAMQEGYDHSKSFERFGRLMAEFILTKLQKRIEDLQFLSAEERYLQFMEERPGLYERVSLSHLASYLGVRRPSLSRIRSKLAKEGIL